MGGQGGGRAGKADGGYTTGSYSEARAGGSFTMRSDGLLYTCAVAKDSPASTPFLATGRRWYRSMLVPATQLAGSSAATPSVGAPSSHSGKSVGSSAFSFACEQQVGGEGDGWWVQHGCMQANAQACVSAAAPCSWVCCPAHFSGVALQRACPANLQHRRLAHDGSIGGDGLRHQDVSGPCAKAGQPVSVGWQAHHVQR